ncbi:hypothetical protein ACFS7Z_13425 [Pontibacter toksunensis]|uniref:Uncharacterized protein n=1 Tax=Pontibacter toksunensis TaxID=1332631 RepID=A0ABW6BYB3_9BACT
MQNELPQERVTLSFMDADFLVIAVDVNHCSAEIKWLRQVSSEECRRGLKLVLHIAAALKTELRKTQALVQA